MEYKVTNNGKEISDGTLPEGYPRGTLEFYDARSVEFGKTLDKVEVHIESHGEAILVRTENGFSGSGESATLAFGAEVYRLKNRPSHIRVKVWAHPRKTVFHPSVKNRPY